MTTKTTARSVPNTEVSSGSAAPSLSRADRFQPFLLIGSIAIGLGLAEIAPNVAQSLAPIVPAGVFALIYLIMLGLDGQRVSEAFAQRRFLVLAIAINFIVNPLLAWVLGSVFLRDNPDLRIGLILFLVTPCIGWYLIFTELAGGDTGLGVSLLGINIVLQVALLPVYLSLFTGASASVDLAEILGSVAVFLVAPAGVAAATRALVRRSAVSLADVDRFIASAHLKTAALAAVIIAMFASQAQVLRDNPTTVATLLVPMTLFFAIAFVVAITVGRLTRLPHEQTALLVFTTTSRNSEASLAIAATAFASPLVALTVVIGPIIELPLLVLMVRLIRKRSSSP